MAKKALSLPASVQIKAILKKNEHWRLRWLKSSVSLVKAQ